MKVYRLMLFLMLVATLFSGLSGCTPAPAAPATEAPAAPAEPTTLVIVMNMDDAVTFDPAIAGETTNLFVHNSTYDQLVEIKADGFDFVVLLGSPEYYQRFGFQTASAFGLQNEYGVDEEFMVLNLSGRELPSGLVRYTEEFGIFSV